MEPNTLDLWQKEAARFESAVHLNMTRAYAFIGIGLTGIASALVGMFVSKRVETVLLVPLILLVLLPIVLTTLQEVLVKALYQYRAETEIARILATSKDPRPYPTWEDFGGRIGNESKTTRVFWISNLLVASFLGVGSVAFFIIKGGPSRLFPITEQNAFITVAILVAAVGASGLLVAVVRVFLRMFASYLAIKEAFGYSEEHTIAQAIQTLESSVDNAQTTTTTTIEDHSA